MLAPHQTVLILDFGSQTTQLIARRIRELGVYCEIRPCTTPYEPLPDHVVGLILGGGPSSVYGDDAPPFDDRWLGAAVPVLGICYGMQLLAMRHGGAVERADRREYGPAVVLPAGAPQTPVGKVLAAPRRVWMSHGDHVSVVPPGWHVVSASENGSIAAMESGDGRRVGLQFHPEVTHSEGGVALLSAFVLDTCGARGDWTIQGFVAEQVAAIRSQVGESHVLCALSGGVDSSVTAALLRRAIGDRLHCVFVDNGLLRDGERAQVAAEFSDFSLTVVDARARFYSALAGVVDPEQKRKVIGRTFIEVFDEQATLLVEQTGSIDFLAQGTLYPDVIESVSFKGPSATIKSHHNVGGLPENMRMKLVEPLRELFKDEVRALGLELGLSHARVFRQPFPGPGLGVRILGEVTAERVELLQRADRIVDEEIRAAGLYETIWQAFAVLLPVQSVGVMGDARTYQQTAVIRAVHSSDGMTANIARLPWELLERMSSRIINEVWGINRVAYDISNKPPATIEWE